MGLGCGSDVWNRNPQPGRLRDLIDATDWAGRAGG